MKIVMFPANTRKDDNPFVNILVGALRRNGVEVEEFGPFAHANVSALHVHWLEGITWGRIAGRVPPWASFLTQRLSALARALRVRGRPVVWTVHNLKPHDFRSKVQRLSFETVMRDFLPLVSDVICMSSSVREAVLETYPDLADRQLHVIRHPSYVAYFAGRNGELPSETAGWRERQAEGPVLGTFGMLRRYKAVPETIEILRTIDRPFRFLVGGEGPQAEVDAIRAAMGDDSRFHFVARRLTDAEILGLTRACGLVLFNFQSILNSGSVLAALSMGRPILAPALGAMIDLEADVGAPWVNTFNKPLTKERVAAVLDDLPTSGAPNLSAYEPDVLARALASVYGAATG